MPWCPRSRPRRRSVGCGAGPNGGRSRSGYSSSYSYSGGYGSGYRYDPRYDGYDGGRVDSERQSGVEVPVLDRSRRRTAVRVRVWTDLGESAWSDPVVLDSGLLHAADWTAAWIGVPEDVVADLERQVGPRSGGAVSWPWNGRGAMSR